MYIDNGVCWKREAIDKDIYIFGGGKNGEYVYKRLLANEIKNIKGILDNSLEVVERFNSGGGWYNNALSPENYKKIINYESDLIIISTDVASIKTQLGRMGIFNCISWEEIDLSLVGESNYESSYFDFQVEIAKVDSKIDKDFFQKYISIDSVVAEFGSGGGLLLRELECKSKIGIDINPYARDYACEIGIKVVDNMDELTNESIDVFISSHALEHCISPFEIVSNIWLKLRKGGKAVFVVPYEPLSFGYMLNDNNQHLYTWTERTLGNLFRVAGFYIREAGTKEVEWPSNWLEIYNNAEYLFEAFSKLESYRTGYYSVYVVAEKI